MPVLSSRLILAIYFRLGCYGDGYPISTAACCREGTIDIDTFALA